MHRRQLIATLGGGFVWVGGCVAATSRESGAPGGRNTSEAISGSDTQNATSSPDDGRPGQPIDVDRASGRIGDGDTVSSVHLRVSFDSITDRAELEEMTLHFTRDETVELVHEAVDESGIDNRFSTSRVSASNEASCAYAESDTRHAVHIPLKNDDLTPDLPPLESGETATVTIITATKYQTEMQLQVPEPMPYAEVGDFVGL